MESRMLSLPSLFALGSMNEKKFVGCVTGGALEDYIESYITDVFDRRAMFAVENGPAGFVHIRSCYSNKYLIRESATGDCIAAKATEPVQDEKAWDCTLFQALLSSDKKTKDESEVPVVMITHKHTGCLLMETQFGNNWSVTLQQPSQLPFLMEQKNYSWRIFDLVSLIKLPRYVAFKDKIYGKFLAPYTWQMANVWPHGFIVDDISHPSIVYEIIHTGEGRIKVKNTWTGMFWILRSKKYLTLLGVSPSTVNSDDATELEVVKVDDETNIVGLRNPENNYFYGRHTIYGTAFTMLSVFPSAFYPVGTALVNSCRLEVFEPILRRRVDQVEYRLNHSRIYDKTPITVFEAKVENSSYDKDQSHVAEISYAKVKSSSWNNSVTMSIKMERSFRVSFNSFTPVMVNGKLKVSNSCSRQDRYEWGETTETSEQVKSQYIVPIPPRHIATITVNGIKAKSEIPFSYIQVDTFHDGSEKAASFNEGVYHGVETYAFQHNATFKPL